MKVFSDLARVSVREVMKIVWEGDMDQSRAEYSRTEQSIVERAIYNIVIVFETVSPSSPRSWLHRVCFMLYTAKPNRPRLLLTITSYNYYL